MPDIDDIIEARRAEALAVYDERLSALEAEVRELAQKQVGMSQSAIAANIAIFQALQGANDQQAVWDNITATLTTGA